MRLQPYRYHAFVSHAVDDKIGIATELCARLESKGLKIWYSSNLPYGESLSQEVYDGMNNSRFGIVIFSPSYLRKTWTMLEFAHLWNRDGKTKPPTVVLPVYYKITPEEVNQKIPIVGDRFSVNVDRGIDVVADKIAEYITKENIRTRKLRRMNFGIALLTLAMVFLCAFYWWKLQQSGLPSDGVIDKLITERIQAIDAIAKEHQPTTFQFAGGIPSNIFADSIYKAYNKTKSYYRNEYEFTNLNSRVTARKNVNEILSIAAQSLTPQNKYGMDSAHIFHIQNSERDFTYYYINRAPVVRTVDVVSKSEKLFVVEVQYQNNIRLIKVDLHFPTGVKDTKRHKMSLTGFRPLEAYEIRRSGSGWKLVEIESGHRERNP